MVVVYFEKRGYNKVESREPISKPMHHRAAIQFAKRFIKENQSAMCYNAPYGYVSHNVCIIDENNTILNTYDKNCSKQL